MPLSVFGLLVAWGVSTLIIYLAVRIYPRKRKRSDLTNSLVAALLGAIVFEISTYFGMILGTLVAFLIWLLILKKIFNVGWIGATAISVII
jgi:multisubunit Na+/H+ antiporter MnhB subunit